MKNYPRHIGTAELWSGRLLLPNTDFSTQQIQETVTNYVTESAIAVIGCLVDKPPMLTLLRWPDTRPGYSEPSIEECQTALSELASRLGAVQTQRNVIAPGYIHCMMGLKKDGYGTGDIAPMSVLTPYMAVGMVALEGQMISARINGNGQTETYGEPVVEITAPLEAEKHIHALGNKLEQWHYVIEYGSTPDNPGKTIFYETEWAK